MDRELIGRRIGWVHVVIVVMVGIAVGSRTYFAGISKPWALVALAVVIFAALGILRRRTDPPS